MDKDINLEDYEEYSEYRDINEDLYCESNGDWIIGK